VTSQAQILTSDTLDKVLFIEINDSPYKLYQIVLPLLPYKIYPVPVNSSPAGMLFMLLKELTNHSYFSIAEQRIL
jgi:hypothetical protein